MTAMFMVECAPVSFQESPDYRELIDPLTPYLVRLERVGDRETRIGEALEWVFAIHDRETRAPILKADGKILMISRITSPQTGPRTRTRRFIEALLGQALSKDQLKGLLQTGALAGRLKDREAVCFVELETATDGNEYPRINELLPIDSGKPGKPPLAPPPRTYEEVFDSEPAATASPDTNTPAETETPVSTQVLLDIFVNVRLPALAAELHLSAEQVSETLGMYEAVLNAAATANQDVRLRALCNVVEVALRDQAGSSPPAAA